MFPEHEMILRALYSALLPADPMLAVSDTALVWRISRERFG
jgi:hypothetical protein